MRASLWTTQPKGKPLVVLIALICVAASGIAGYFAEALRQNAPAVMPVSRVAGLEYFLQPRSFSEIEQTKTLLEALAAQVVTELRTRRGVAVVEAAGRTRPQHPTEKEKLSEAIQELEQRMGEFKGVEQELLLARELLILLHRLGDNDRWLEVYLRILYEHPTNELVGALAQRALLKAKETGRENEVQGAFQLVNGIPLDFSAKSKVAAVMRHAPFHGRLTPGGAPDPIE